MKHNLTVLLEMAGISLPPVGVYDLPDASDFTPVARPIQCIFESYQGWLKGESTVIDARSAASFGCPGAGYWLCGIETMPQEASADYLAGQEGLKASTQIMRQWLVENPPHGMDNEAIVITRLRDDCDEFLKTVTFFVNPDQLGFMLTGAEYLNASADQPLVMAPYGSGCGQLLPMFQNLEEPRAIIGATDIAMRKYLPQDILAFTMTKPMFSQLCGLDQNSFMHKTFWRDLKHAREMVTHDGCARRQR